MDTDDQSHLNKIDAPTSLQIRLLAPQDNPVVDVLLQWASTPSAADLASIERLGGVWSQVPGGAPVVAPTDLQTLRLPLRALPEVARLPAVRALSASAVLSPDAPGGGHDPAGGVDAVPPRQ